MKYDGSDWVYVGNPEFSPGAALNINLALDSSGTPYVAYADGAGGRKATVMKDDGSNWVYVGNPGFSPGDARNIDLKLDSSGTPYVTYQDRLNSNNAKLMFYHNTTVGE